MGSLRVPDTRRRDRALASRPRRSRGVACPVNVPRFFCSLTLGLFLWLISGGAALASSNLPLHHWGYDAIERLIALEVIDRALVGAKPFTRMQAAQYVARAIERVRTDEVALDGREAIAEPLLERLLVEFRPELIRLGTIRARPEDKSGSVRFGARVTSEVDASSIGGGQTIRFRENRGGSISSTVCRTRPMCVPGRS